MDLKIYQLDDQVVIHLQISQSKENVHNQISLCCPLNLPTLYNFTVAKWNITTSDKVLFILFCFDVRTRTLDF